MPEIPSGMGVGVPDESRATQQHHLAHLMNEPRLNDVILEGKYVLRMTFRHCYLSCKYAIVRK
jgi:hypothetical protein